ncbi:Phosphoenolpyruvate carboxykinase (GTP) [Candidatus Desulfarcum epimagneticum]|uniref:phosphoenolpyruvate carboxykinase (GTP) n=1 Tax=uncultured Desulfobacteraceae bacterium TaxID=218296 RepID=A0A484HDW9_9BACT|nr:Phosphoenolpyruvate carboxykinase (GTP) [uncultured Desulfobacteraceae bacterium]
MPTLNPTIDIALKIGKIETRTQAEKALKDRMDADSFEKISRIQNEFALVKLANAAVMCGPDSIFIHTGSDQDRGFIRDLALKKGEEEKLAMKGHTLHYDLKDEQGRIVDRTYYIADKEEQISSLARRMERGEAAGEVGQKMSGIMAGKIMMAGFYMRGPAGSPVSDPAIEISSSAYVLHSADILYRNIFSEFDREVDRAGHCYVNIHSQGENRPQDLPHARVFMDRRDQTTYSLNCTYAGNTLLLKKGNHRFSVDRSVYRGRGRELAEHMFITGVRGPGGRVSWITGAAPSGCGKTTTAMAGDHFLGDDLAHMWIAEDGTVRSVNPEIGIFGIVEDVNAVGDPILIKALRNEGAEVIWSNVLVDEAGVPHWTGSGEEPPEKGRNFQGPWERGMTDEKGARVPMSHPNARCTISARALENCSEKLDDPDGVETRVVTYSGRDSDTMPPVWAARTPREGVAIGASIVSAATATEVGAKGVKRAPWANAPFIPGSLADYMDAQFKFFENPQIDDAKRPILAGLNYFLTDEARGGSSKNLLGEKRDVKVWLAWLERLAHGEVSAINTPIGRLPLYGDLNILFKGLIEKDYPEDLYVRQFSLYIDPIMARIDLQTEAYGKETGVPAALFEVYETQRRELSELRKKFGPVASPSRLLSLSV